MTRREWLLRHETLASLMPGPDLRELVRQLHLLNHGQVLRAASVDPLTLRYARPDTIGGAPVVSDPWAPPGRIMGVETSCWPRPVEAVDESLDEALDESLTCCGDLFETHAQWWQHRKAAHRRQDTVQTPVIDEDGAENHVRVSAWRTAPCP